MPMIPDSHPNSSSKRPAWWVIVLAFISLAAFLAMLWLGLQRARQGPITIGDPVPAFELTTFNGEIINTGSLAGKVIVINFWASWCVTCDDEAAALEEAWQKYQPQGNVVFLGVDYSDTEPEALAYLEQYQITYANGADLGTRISQMFRVHSVPETYIIGSDGKLAYIKIGPFVSLSEVISAIDSVLTQN